MLITIIADAAKYPTDDPATLGTGKAPLISDSYVEISIELTGISGEVHAYLLGWDDDCGWTPIQTLILNERPDPPLVGRNRFDQIFIPSERNVCIYAPTLKSANIAKACIEGYMAPATPDFSNPPELGNGTPNKVNATMLAIQDSSAAVPTAKPGFVQIFSPDGSTVGAQGKNGSLLYQKQEQLPAVVGTSTAIINKRTIVLSVPASGGTIDVPINGSGHGVLTQTGSANTISGRFSYASDAHTDDNGVTQSLFDITDTPGSLCIFASGGALRVKNNNLGVAVCILDLTELQHS